MVSTEQLLSSKLDREPLNLKGSPSYPFLPKTADVSVVDIKNTALPLHTRN